MNIKLVSIVGGVLALLIAVLIIQRLQMKNLQLRLNESQQLTESLGTTIETMKQQNAKVALISETKTEELERAKDKIEQLEHDVAAGSKRLYVNASCPTVSTEPGTASVDDERTAKLTRNAERAYFRLRKQHELVIKQLTGLQEYVRALPAECVSQPLVTAR